MLNNRLMARSAPVTWVGAPRALGARPPSCLQRASVRARCSAQPSPQPQPPGKARLSSAGLHIAGDVSLHIGTLNLHMSPSAPIAATAAAPTTSALPAPDNNQVRQSGGSITAHGFNINSFFLSLLHART